MTTATLELRFAGQPQRAPAAWRLPGNAAAGWLAELTGWSCPHRDIRLAPLPASRRDRAPAAALATVAAGELPAASAGCVAYGRVGSRLYLPVDGRLWPAVADAELDQMLSAHRLYVWDPAVGLIALEGDGWLRLSDLLERPASSRANWDRAEAGLVLAPRLEWLGAAGQIDADEVVEEGHEDIGDRKGEAGELPPAPEEGAPGARGAVGRQGRKLAAGAAKAVSNVVPGSWAERLGNWAGRQMESVSRSLEAARNRELERLMHLLDTDPDQGLKYALPLGGGGEHRGRAKPGSRLGERDVNFDAARLGRAGAADSWSVSYDYQIRLRTKYREAANRELQLGRYRRAAYIYAELLGDHRAAAGALEEGRHFRDAAALYRQKLGDPGRAAACLEQGGLWIEAIELYVEQKNFVRAGELYEQLGQLEKAREQFRAAVEQMRAGSRDRLAIAKLLTERLQAYDEAMDELDGAWPRSPQAVACMQQWFRLAMEHADDPRCASQVERVVPEDGELLAADAAQRDPVFNAADVLLWVAERHPSPEISRQAADRLLSAVATAVPGLDAEKRGPLLRRIWSLAPDDKLLQRDCRRFATTSPAPQPQSPGQRRRDSSAPVLVWSTRLPDHVQWQQVCLCGRSMFVAGVGSRTISLAQVSTSTHELELEQWPAPSKPGELLLSAAIRGDEHLLLHGISCPLETRQLVREVSNEPATAGSTPGLGPRTIAACRTTAGHTWSVAFEGDHCVLTGTSDDHAPLRSHVLEAPEEEPAYMPRIGAVAGTIYVSMGSRLLMWGEQGRLDTLELSRPIRRLACGGTRPRSRVAIGFEAGGVALLDVEGLDLRPFGDGLVEPEVCFTKGGYLIAAADSRTEVYDTGGGELKLKSVLESGAYPRRGRPVAVSPAPRSDHFAILYAGGELRIYEVP